MLAARLIASGVRRMSRAGPVRRSSAALSLRRKWKNRPPNSTPLAARGVADPGELTFRFPFEHGADGKALRRDAAMPHRAGFEDADGRPGHLVAEPCEDRFPR